MADILQFPGLPPKQKGLMDIINPPVQNKPDMFGAAAKAMGELTPTATPIQEEMFIQLQHPDGTLGDKIPMSKAQHKAMQLVMQGMTFVFVGLTPTPKGADFFTAIHGDETDLRNAADELPNVISRALAKEGII